MAASTHRKTPSRASLPRRTTRGPLDDDEDPLSATLSPASPSSVRSSVTTTPLAKSQDVNPFEKSDAHLNLLDDTPVEASASKERKDLSFLLDTSIYHPLSQVDVPSPLRKPPVPSPTSTTTVLQAQAQLDGLISSCDFVNAAQYAASCLTHGVVQPNDFDSIFKLLAVRYSCLELIGQVLLAAQEAKALEDLSSDFYYVASQTSEDDIQAHGGLRRLPQHIMPFSLRVQAIRLQNIGFSDPRRGVTALYDLGLEVRDHLTSPYTTDPERRELATRLHSLSMHVVNALIELGDVDCAQRTLTQSRPPDTADIAHQTQWTTRMVLMLVKLGRLKQAKNHVAGLTSDDETKTLLLSTIAVANGKVEEAAQLLQNLQQQGDSSPLRAFAEQNLAVAHLYAGRVQESRKILEDLVERGHTSHSLTLNLATIFDLTSDRSRDSKMQLVNKMASQKMKSGSYTNADFKL